MSENYKIMSKFIKDISGETPDIETYLYVKDFISKYQLNIEINSKPLKAQIVEINTLLKFHDVSESKKKSHFEMTYTSVIKLNEEIKDKKILQKIILCDVQNEIFPKLETRSDQLAKTMSGGEQQMLAIARGMMGLPKLLMVDEPFLGLSPMVMKDLIKLFKNIVAEGFSILNVFAPVIESTVCPKNFLLIIFLKCQSGPLFLR